MHTSIGNSSGKKKFGLTSSVSFRKKRKKTFPTFLWFKMNKYRRRRRNKRRKRKRNDAEQTTMCASAMHRWNQKWETKMQRGSEIVYITVLVCLCISPHHYFLYAFGVTSLTKFPYNFQNPISQWHLFQMAHIWNVPFQFALFIFYCRCWCCCHCCRSMWMCKSVLSWLIKSYCAIDVWPMVSTISIALKLWMN